MPVLSLGPGSGLGRAGPGGGAPALVAVAHGSRDPRSAATVAELTAEVRRQSPDVDVRLSFLDLNTPRLADVLAAVAADGHRAAAVVPLLLGDAYHARVDLPGAVASVARRHPRVRLVVADVLGSDPRLPATALRRLAHVAGPLHGPAADGLGVVLAAIGSSHPAANAAVVQLATRWAGDHPWLGATAAFATASAPSVPEAVLRMRAAGASRVAVASWFLAPGLLPARVADGARAVDPDVRIAAPLGPDPLVAEVVLARYRAAVSRTAHPERSIQPA
jgi:sirohydrochlorin ferrochelatase